jgi:hypothetical protein
VLRNKWPNSKQFCSRKLLRGEEIGIWRAREFGARVRSGNSANEKTRLTESAGISTANRAD